MSDGEFVGGYVGDLWVGIAPEQLRGGGKVEIDGHLEKLAGEHHIDAARAFDSAELQIPGVDESPDAFSCEYSQPVRGGVV